MASQTKRLQIELKEIPESAEQEEFPDDNQPRTKNEDSNRLFTPAREVVLFCLTAFYAADIALDVWVAVRLFHGGSHPKSGWFVVFCILLPNLYAGYKSLQWYLRSHDEDPVKSPVPWMLRVFFFPVSVLLRYHDSWHKGRLSKKAWSNHDRQKERYYFNCYLIESAEVSMLRLFIIFLEDAPIAVLNLKEVLLTPPATQKQAMAMCSVVIAKLFLTMTLGVVHFTSSMKAVYHAASSGCYFKGIQLLENSSSFEWGQRGLLSLPAECCVYLWHLCSIASRLVSYAMFVSVYQRYVWILIAIRWTIHTAWIKYDVSEMSLGNCLAFGGVYLFSFVPTSPGRQINRIILYYIITFAENVAIAILWHDAAPHNPYACGAYGIVFGGAAGGIIFLCIYYGCFHPARNETYMYKLLRDRIQRSIT